MFQDYNYIKNIGIKHCCLSVCQFKYRNFFFKRQSADPKSISFKSNISTNFVQFKSYLFTVGFFNLEHFEVTDKLNITGNFSTLQVHTLHFKLIFFRNILHLY